MPIHNSSQADELAGQRRQRSASTSCLRCAVSGNDQRASGAGVLLAALVAVALLAPSSAASGVQAVRPCTGLPWGALKHADERLGDKAPVSMPGKSPLLALRLKGGRGCTGTRNSCKQRKYHMKTGVMKDAKRNRPIALSHRPCTGSWAKSKMERWHGTAVIQQAMWQSTPRSPFHDPRTAALRLGLRWNRFETNNGFKRLHKDLNHCLLKACMRGLKNLVPGLIENGADINYMGQAKTGLSAELVGLTPIRAAAHQGWPTTVRMLLDLGADHRGGIEDDPLYSEDGKELWMRVAKANAARRKQTKQDMNAKMMPYQGQGRRTPGVRRTRTPHGTVRPKR